ncbi:amidase [Acephala macrosclerotiorum]|nr:amidase [Acephala macrosclerotiorum]
MTYDDFLPGKQSWQVIAAEKRCRDMAKIPKDWILPESVVKESRARRSIMGNFIEDLLDGETLLITNLDVPEIVERTSNGSLTAVQVVTAYSKRAAYAHQLSHILLEVAFDIALERAKELDEYFEKNQKPIGPLHGVPLTLKDQFHIKGLETSMAYVGWIGTFEGEKGTGKEKNTESELIRELYSLGAIPIGKAPETNNNILGYAWNPHNQLLSTGGSSGGEGAMQALRGSAFGIGTDIGGSVSMPASFNGVFSIKPSAGRISFKDVANTGPGQMIMPTVAGIMGHSVETLRLVFKALLSTEPWLYDPYVLEVPWREYSVDHGPGNSSLSFGLVKDDGVVTPHPPIARALEIVQKAMLAAGHETIPWEPPSVNESIAIHGPIARGDGCPDVFEAIHISGEPIVPEIQHLFPNGQLQPPMNLVNYEKVVMHMKDYRQRYHDYWSSTANKTRNGRPVEAIILPVSPYAAVLPGKFFHSPYTSFINVLDYTTIVIPITFADKNIDVIPSGFVPLTEKDRVNMDSYDAEIYHGAPASIQIVAKKMEEEKLLAMAQIVVDALEKYQKSEEGKGNSS